MAVAVALKKKKKGIFFFNDTATTEIYALSLHDALPIYTNPAPETHQRRTIPERGIEAEIETLGREFFHRSGLIADLARHPANRPHAREATRDFQLEILGALIRRPGQDRGGQDEAVSIGHALASSPYCRQVWARARSEEHTSELQSH